MGLWEYWVLRPGEFTTHTLSFNPSFDLTLSDISMHAGCFSLFLKLSKTDVDGHGVSIRIAANNTLFCPLSSMTTYLRSRAMMDAEGGEPLFSMADGKPMTRCWFSTKLRSLCRACGLPADRYTPHSLRIGTAAASVAPVPTVKQMGRWTSDAVDRYIRPDGNSVLQAQLDMSNA